MFGKLLEAAIKTVTLPVAVVADVVTMGGALNDRDKPYTIQQLESIKDDIDEIGD